MYDYQFSEAVLYVMQEWIKIRLLLYPVHYVLDLAGDKILILNVHEYFPESVAYPPVASGGQPLAPSFLQTRPTLLPFEERAGPFVLLVLDVRLDGILYGAHPLDVLVRVAVEPMALTFCADEFQYLPRVAHRVHPLKPLREIEIFPSLPLGEEFLVEKLDMFRHGVPLRVLLQIHEYLVYLVVLAVGMAQYRQFLDEHLLAVEVFLEGVLPGLIRPQPGLGKGFAESRHPRRPLLGGAVHDEIVQEFLEEEFLHRTVTESAVRFPVAVDVLYELFQRPEPRRARGMGLVKRLHHPLVNDVLAYADQAVELGYTGNGNGRVAYAFYLKRKRPAVFICSFLADHSRVYRSPSVVGDRKGKIQHVFRGQYLEIQYGVALYELAAHGLYLKIARSRGVDGMYDAEGAVALTAQGRAVGQRHELPLDDLVKDGHDGGFALRAFLEDDRLPVFQAHRHRAIIETRNALPEIRLQGKVLLVGIRMYLELRHVGAVQKLAYGRSEEAFSRALVAHEDHALAHSPELQGEIKLAAVGHVAGREPVPDVLRQATGLEAFDCVRMQLDPHLVPVVFLGASRPYGFGRND